MNDEKLLKLTMKLDNAHIIERIEALESVLKEWIDWTLESFNVGVNDEYLEKLKQIKKKLSAKDEREIDSS